MKLFSISSIVAALIALTATFAFSDEGKRDAAQSKPAFQGNATCPVSGEKVDTSVFVERGGERIYFCCKNCMAKAGADLEGTYAKAYPEDKAVDAKNTTCPVMGEALDKDAKSVTIQGHKIGVCCPACDKKLRKSAQFYLALISDPTLVAAKNKKCPVSGEDVNLNQFVITDGVVVNTCCAKCVAALEKDSAEALKKAGIDTGKIKADAKVAAEKAAGEKKKDG